MLPESAVMKIACMLSVAIVAMATVENIQVEQDATSLLQVESALGARAQLTKRGPKKDAVARFRQALFNINPDLAKRLEQAPQEYLSKVQEHLSTFRQHLGTSDYDTLRQELTGDKTGTDIDVKSHGVLQSFLVKGIQAYEKHMKKQKTSEGALASEAAEELDSTDKVLPRTSSGGAKTSGLDTDDLEGTGSKSEGVPVWLGGPYWPGEEVQQIMEAWDVAQTIAKNAGQLHMDTSWAQGYALDNGNWLSMIPAIGGSASNGLTNVYEKLEQTLASQERDMLGAIYPLYGHP